MKSKTKQTSKGISTLYVLAKECNQYSIVCVEENLKDKTLEIHKAPLISHKEKDAMAIFKKVVKGKALGYTLCDIVCDLLS